MNNSFDPQINDIVTAYRLYENLNTKKKREKNKDKVKKNSNSKISKENRSQENSDNKISNLFLVNRKAGLNFVKKRSLRAAWLRIRRGKKAFDISKNMSHVASILKNVSELEETQENDYFEQAAAQVSSKGKKVTAENVKDALNQLRADLEGFRAHIAESHKVRDKFVNLEELPSLVFKAEVAKNEEVKQTIQKIFPNTFSEEQLKEISLFLISYSGTPQLLASLRDPTKTSNEKTQDMQDAIRTAMSRSPQDKAQNWLEALQELQPKQQKLKTEQSEPKEDESPIKLKNFALVFGDDFIRESGLEGDVTSKIYADLAAQYIDTLPVKTEKELVLQHDLRNGLNLKGYEHDINRLKNEIKERIEASPGKRSLLYAGWVGHAIVYEIVEQENGKYTFRIYNLGQGINFHKQTEMDYQLKTQGCVAIKDISEKSMFDLSFLGSLQALTSRADKVILNKSPHDLLYKHLLSCLNGEQEHIQDHVQEYLSPQKSGTCPYRSVEAFIANNLSETENAVFDFEFKLYLLKLYLPELEKRKTEIKQLTDLIKEGNAKDYDNLILEYSLIVRSLEKFSSNLSKVQSILPDKVKEALSIIDEYNAELVLIDKALIEFERNVYGTRLSDLSTGERIKLGFNRESDSKKSENKITPNLFSLDILSVQKQIESIPSPDHGDFSKIVESCLSSVSALPETPEGNYVREAFFKQLASFQSWDKIKYENPSRALENLTKISTVLSSDLPGKAKQYAMYLSTCYAIGLSYQQCDSKIRLIPPDFKSLLATGIHFNVPRLQSSDPFWSHYLSELQSHLKSTPECDYFPEVNYAQPQGFSLDSRIAECISNWWGQKENAGLRQKLEESVKKDREIQEKEIELKTAQLQRKVAEMKASLANIKDQGNHLNNGKIKGIKPEIAREIELEIARLNLSIANTPSKVKNDSKYWPEGFEDIQKDSYLLASYLFGNQSFIEQKLGDTFFKDQGRETLFPQEFRQFYTTFLDAKNIFDKKEKGPISLLKMRCDLMINRMEFWIESDSKFKLDLTSLRNDTYIGNLGDLVGIYKKSRVNYTQIHETGIPALVKELSGSTSLKSDEIKEALSLRLTIGLEGETSRISNVQIESILNYFEENYNKLDSNKWVNFFHSLLFESDLLLKEIDQDITREPMLSRMTNFFEKSIASAIENENYATAANMYWIAVSTQNYIEFVSQNRVKQGNPPFNYSPLANPEWMLRIFKEGMDPKFAHQRSEILEAILAVSKTTFEKPLLNEEDKKLFALAIIAHTFIREFPTNPENQCYHRKEEGKDASDALRMALSKDPPQYSQKDICDLLNKYGTDFISLISQDYKNVYFNNPTPDKFAVVDRTTKEPKAVLHLSNGIFETHNPDALVIFDKYLSDEVVQRLIKEKVFPKDENFSKMRCCIGREGADEIVQISYPEKNLKLKLVNPQSENTKIYIQLPGESSWSTLYRETEIEKNQKAWKFTNQELKNNYIFIVQKNTLCLCDPNSFKPVFELTDLNTEGMRRISDGLFVMHPPDPSAFSTFEDPNCTIFLADKSNTLLEVQFPRLGITLTREKKEDPWSFAEQKGWELASAQFAPHLGQGTGFLVFQNKENSEQKKVLLPVWDSEVASEKSLNFPYHYKFQSSEVRKNHCVEYTLTGNAMIPNSVEARYYLARIFLEKGRLDEAEKLLFANESLIKHRKLSDNEKDVLKKIAYSNVSKTISSRSLVLRLRAMFLLESNERQFPLKEKKLAQQDLSEVEMENKKNKQLKLDLIKDYLSGLEDIHPLSEQEERLLLTPFRNDPLIKRRLIELGFEFTEPSIDIEQHPPLDDILISTVDAEISAQKPSLKQRNEYSRERKNHQFPFDPTRVSDFELANYYKSLEMECHKTESWKQANKSGLAQALYCMTYFSVDINVRKQAQALLAILEGKFKSERKASAEKRIRISPSAKSPEKSPVKEPESMLSEYGKDLPAIATLPKTSLEEIDYLKKLAEDFFDPKKLERLEVPELFLEGSLEASDKTIQKKFAQTQKDLEAAGQFEEIRYELKDPSQLIRLQGELLRHQASEKEQLVNQEYIILESVHSALTSSTASKAEFLSKKRQLPTMNELSVICAKRDSKTYIKKLYPELSDEGIKTLQKAIKQTLIQKKTVQFYDRSVGLVGCLQEELGKETPNHEMIRSVSNQLGKSLATPPYDMSNDSHAEVFLLIETLCDIQLRSQQIETVKKFIESFEKGDEIAVQMIMGGGKTSFIQPILAFLFAKPGVFSVIDVPEHLFEKVIKELVEKLGSGFDQYVYTMPYNRNKAKSIDYLDNFLIEIQEAKAKGACFLRTPKVKESILASLYEAYYNEDDERIDRIGKICQFLKENEIVQFDEIDLTMNPNVIFKYSLGGSKTVDKEQATLLSKILIDVASDRTLSQEVSVDFIDAFQKRHGVEKNKDTVSITEERYRYIVKPRLAEIALKHLGKQIPSLNGILKEDSNQYIKRFITQSTPFDAEIEEKLSKEELIQITNQLKTDYPELKNLRDKVDSLSDEKQKLVANRILFTAEANTFISQNFPDKQYQELLAVCAQSIDIIFKTSFCKECGTQYGPQIPKFDKHGKPKKTPFVSIPYAAANAPKVTKFGDPCEEVIYSTQLALHYGVPRDGAMKMLTSIQAKARSEMGLGVKMGSPLKLTETEAYRKYERILGKENMKFHFFEDPISEEHLASFQQAVSKNKNAFLEFLQTYLYRDIKFYPTSVSVTPQTLANSSNLSYGYTGTMHEGVLSKSMKAEAEAGVDGKTILAVQNKMEKKLSKIQEYLEENGPLPEQLIGDFLKDPDFYVFIDSGGWLKDEIMKDFAIKLLKACEVHRPEIKGIVYHNKTGKEISLEKDPVTGEYAEILLEHSMYKPKNGQQLTLIGQKYETGTDIPQKSTAKAKMSVRKNMTKRDALQSEFRMREILAGQSVDLVFDREVGMDVRLQLFNSLMKNSEFRKLLQTPDNDEAYKNFIQALGANEKIKEALSKTFQEYQKNSEIQAMNPNDRSFEFFKTFAKNLAIDSKDAWRYFTANEGRVEQDKNWAAGKQRMREVIEGPIRTVLSNTKIPIQERKQIFREFQELVLQDSDESRFLKVCGGTHLVSGATAIELEKEKYKKFVTKIESLLKSDQIEPQTKVFISQKIEELNPGKKGSVRAILEKALDECIKEEDIAVFIEIGSVSVGDEIEIEKEREIEKEAEQEKQIEKEVEKEFEIRTEFGQVTNKEYTPLVALSFAKDYYHPLEFSKKNFPTIASLLTDYPAALSDADKIEVSPNLFIEHQKFGTDSRGDYQLAGRFLLAIKDAHNTRYLLVSHEDASKIKKGMIQLGRWNKFPALELLTFDGSTVISSNEPGKGLDQTELKRILVQCKICTGKTVFTNEELKVLSTNVKNSPDEGIQTRRLYEEVLKHMPGAAETYVKSRVHKILEGQKTAGVAA